MTDLATTWRLIVTSPLSGAENMAIDEALLHSFDPALSLPVLRLYGWNPPALSLGRFQKAAEVLDMERCRDDGVAIVRRMTGGGVIYHADELTYSLVCAPGQIPPASSIKDSFRVLTGFLLAFYRALGLDAAYAVDAAPEGTRLGERTAFCFAGKESFDILANGRKIGGNAQRRLKGVIFSARLDPAAKSCRDRTDVHEGTSPRTCRGYGKSGGVWSFCRPGGVAGTAWRDIQHTLRCESPE
jgi:lipoate-protein ligase A